jgi:hypothetical protein
VNKEWDADCAEFSGRPGACLDGGYFSAKKNGPGIRSVWIVTERDPQPAHMAYACKAYTCRTKEKGKAAKCSGEMGVELLQSEHEDDGKMSLSVEKSKKIAGFVCW